MSEAIDPVNVIYKFKRVMQEQLDGLVQTLANGGIDTMDEYKYIIGKIHAIDLMNQELSNLLEPKEPNNDDDKVTRIRK
jgi:protein subunit release factor A